MIITKPYIFKVRYYETDKMGIVHHSNYIRWMEEARLDYLEQLGQRVDKLEADGVISPVVSVSCNYKISCIFGDIVEIKVKLIEYTGIRYVFEYEIVRAGSGETAATGRSEHCVINKDGRPVSIKRRFPAFDSLLSECVNRDKDCF